MSAELYSRLVEQTAAQIREIYCTERNRWHMEHERKVTAWGAVAIPRYDGGTDNLGRVYQSAWLTLAQFALSHGLDPKRFIRSQFATRMAKPPEPTHLGSSSAVAVYRFQEKADIAELTRLFEYQKERALAEFDKLQPCRARRGWSDRDVHRAVLGNQLVPLSALFRYCIAERDGHTDLADAFHDDAIIQYLAQRDDYDQVWGDWISPTLRMRAMWIIRLAASHTVPIGSEVREEEEPNRRSIIID